MGYGEQLRAAQMASLNAALEQRNVRCDLMATAPVWPEEYLRDRYDEPDADYVDEVG